MSELRKRMIRDMQLRNFSAGTQRAYLRAVADLAKCYNRSPDTISAELAELLDTYNIRPRLGAVGKHGSIAVAERVIKTLKYEWLKRAIFIKGIDHLTMLCGEFETWYNSWRPHMTLDGLRPDDVYYDKKPEKPKHDSKKVPCNIEHRLFRETRIICYRLRNVA